MTVDLSEEELKIIEDWYSSASGESASGASVYPRFEDRTEEAKADYEQDVKEAKRVRALIAKLGFELHYRDAKKL